MDQRNPLHKKRWSMQVWGINPGLKAIADVTRSPKQGYQWPNKKDLNGSGKKNTFPNTCCVFYGLQGWGRGVLEKLDNLFAF